MVVAIVLNILSFRLFGTYQHIVVLTSLFTLYELILIFIVPLIEKNVNYKLFFCYKL